MKKLLAFVFISLFPLTFSVAQDIAVPSTEIITSANVLNLQQIARWQGVDNGFVGASFSPDGKILALALNDGVIRLLDVPTFELEKTLAGADFDGTQLRFSRDGSRLMLADWGETYQLWNVETGEKTNRYNGKLGEHWSDFEADLKFFTVWRDDSSVAVKNIDTGDEIFAVNEVNILPPAELIAGGSLLLTAHDTNFDVWDVNSGTIAYHFDSPDGMELRGFGFSPSGNLIWANWLGWQYDRDTFKSQSIIQFWNVEDGSQAVTLNGGTTHFRMYFSQAEDFIATAGENDQLQDTVWVWSVRQQKLLGEAGIPTGGGLAGFSPDGKLLAVAGGTTARVDIWDAETPEIPIKIALDVESGTSVAPEFSPDGHYLLTVGSDIRLWGIPVES